MAKRRSEAGQTLALVAVALVTLMAAAGLAVDMGYLRHERRLMQSAADSAALAAATDLNLGLTGQGTARADALAVAQSNGFTDGVNNTTVLVTFPVLNGLQAARVSIQQVLPSFFIQVVGANSHTISATGSAAIGTSQGCIYALDVGGTGLTLDAGVNAPNCGIVDNGPLTGPGDITAASAGVYGSFAGYGGFSTPAVVTIPQPAADPLAYLTPPGPAGPCIPDPMVDGASGPLMNGVITLDAGFYCQGITIKAGGIVTFNTGPYYLSGNTGLQIADTGIANSGVGGVTFYNTGTGAFTFSGIGHVTLTAPTVGVGGLPANILFYQDPGNTAAADVSEGGSGAVMLTGTLYLPTAPLTLGGSAVGTNALIVADSVTVAGSNVLNVDSTSNALLPGGSPMQNVSLVE